MGDFPVFAAKEPLTGRLPDALANEMDTHVHVVDRRWKIKQLRPVLSVDYWWHENCPPNRIKEDVTVCEVYMNEQKVEQIKCPVCGTIGSSAATAPCRRCALVDELIEELIRRQTRETRWPVARPKPVLPVRRGSLGLVGATGLEPVTLSFEG